MATAVSYLRPGAMETTFYHDGKQGEPASKKLKTGLNTSRPMTLDFTTSKKKDLKAFTPLLSSPDLNMLKLASPDLERLIIQQNGHVTTTPTPSGILQAKSVTEEQEAYARGFVDALNQLHQQQSPPTSQSLPVTVTSHPSAVTTAASLPNNENSLPAAMVPASTAALPLALTTTTSLPGGVIHFASQQSSEPLRTDSPLYSMSMQGTPQSLIKEEPPQTVPCMGAPMSPIDMESQERIKLERKRARNRVAARKCRTRKLERISRLEERVDELKQQNTDLSATANSLRDQVCQLKKQIMQHVSSGCQIMKTTSLL